MMYTQYTIIDVRITNVNYGKIYDDLQDFNWPEKTVDISRHHCWFPPKSRLSNKLHTDDASLPRSGQCLSLALLLGKFASANQKHYAHPGNDVSSVWNFFARFSDVISPGNQWWRHHPYTKCSCRVMKKISNKLHQGH